MKDLQTGQSGRISDIRGRADYVHRLEEFGLQAGTRIEMFQSGNPCIIRTAGCKICLRADELMITVE